MKGIKKSKYIKYLIEFDNEITGLCLRQNYFKITFIFEDKKQPKKDVYFKYNEKIREYISYCTGINIKTYILDIKYNLLFENKTDFNLYVKDNEVIKLEVN